MRTLALSLLLSALLASPAAAADISGRVVDRSGGVLPGTSITLLNIATGSQTVAVTDATGQFRFTSLAIGIYRVAAMLVGFSDASRTVVIEEAVAETSIDFALDLGAIRAEVTVSADRGTRDLQVVPLRADTLPGEAIRELTPISTGDVLLAAPGVTPVGSGPFQVRPRLRGLDSTRVLVLVDGERLNNARTATDRAGVEVGLIDPDSIDGIEVLGGAGSVLYGTDALSGTINIITNRPRLSDATRVTAGFDGYYSSNEGGRRGTVTLGLSSRSLSASFTGGAERFGDYRAGKDFSESSVPLHNSGRLRQADTVDALGFRFGAFPDPFNAPFTRTSAIVGSSDMEGSSANLAAVARLSGRQTLEVKYQRRRAENVGFPDFEQPFFFQKITLPWSRFDKASATYTATDVTPWLSKVNVTFYRQHQDRLLRNDFPVQFPAPTAGTFFPISVFRLNILSDTRQQVWTPGLDALATFLTHPSNVLTAGVTVFRDRSRDERTTTTETTQIGRVAMGQFGLAATVFPAPIVLGPPTVEHPVRVPNARFRDVGLFLHDEWTASDAIRVTAGLRVDGYRVVAENTPGYSITSTIQNAVPAIAAATLPAVAGGTITRTAVTGEAGIVLLPDRPVSVFAHYVRSYRHPNLEEILFSGPATTGQIVPNITVKPETGHNVDVGTRFRFSRLIGSLSYFNNTYRDFISTEVVARVTSQSGVSPISQAANLARVRIQGAEVEANAPFVAGGLTWLPSMNVSYNRGTVLAGTNPLSGASLASLPQDNITPTKIAATLRVGDRAERWWASYGLRSQAEVRRVSPLLADSEFLIGQDLFGLQGFSIHRLAFGYDLRAGDDRVGFTVAMDNLTDRFYREQFQFAPARGRSISFSIRVRGGR